jgi:hypothetical protein
VFADRVGQHVDPALAAWLTGVNPGPVGVLKHYT